jgi:hypothetical protein
MNHDIPCCVISDMIHFFHPSLFRTFSWVFCFHTFVIYVLLSKLKKRISQPFKTITEFIWLYMYLVSRDSVVGIATSYELDDRRVGVRVPVGPRIFSTSSKPALRSTQPPIQWVPGALLPGVKRQGRDADHSPPASAQVKKMWIYISTPPYAFMA